jgi:hypothetical protein
MTDFKPYFRSDEELFLDRSVALVFYVNSDEENWARITAKLASTSLLSLAIDVYSEAEADEKFVVATRSDLVDAVKSKVDKVGLIKPPRTMGTSVAHALRDLRGALVSVSAAHVMAFSPGFPFIRPSSLSEASRLLKIRADIRSLRACVSQLAPIYDSEAKCLCQKASFACLDVFALAHKSRIERTEALFGESVADPELFELSAMEGFDARDDFGFELAAAYKEHRNLRRNF